jgi:hypothetical protein
MKRKRETTDPENVWFKKLGGGSFHAKIGGKVRIIKPNEIFEARPEEIPEGFKDVVVRLADVPKTGSGPAPAPPKPPSKLEYFVKPRAGAGYYDVVDKDGKKQNEKALRRNAAEALIEKLMA